MAVIPKIRVQMKTGNGEAHNEAFTANRNRIGYNKQMDNTLFEQIDNFGRKLASITNDIYSDSIIEISISINEQLG